MITPAGLALAALASLAALGRRRPRPTAMPTPTTGPNARRRLALAVIVPAADTATRAAGLGQFLPIAAAQAMLETAWGRAIPGKNWYGIKGRGPSGSVNVPTKEEFTPGQITRIRANFRAYATDAESVADWLRFVSGGRYSPARSMSTASAALWIWAAGYATASGYFPALVSVSRRVADLTGLPHLKIEATSAQTELAATLGSLAPNARRKAAADLLAAGRWPP